jgi:GTP-binding protein HflX
VRDGTDPDGWPQALLFGIVPHGDQRTASEALYELQQLADTGEFEVAGCIVQHRRHADPRTYVGSGKLEELAEIVERSRPALLICNDELGPLQGRNIEQAVAAPVMDRSELILHIFGTHARTTQAKLQVELAQLEYQLPRLKRMWTHLERQRGGIGVRGGAGEKQIDLDRRYIQTRIGTITRDLERIGRHRTRMIRARAELFSIALVGYTNAGKSTLMNRMTDADVLAEDRLFSTLDTRTRPWRLDGGRTVLLSDTVGFIRNLPHQLVASFHATLEEALTADLLLVVVDSSSPEAVAQLETVHEVLDQLGASGIRRLHLFNKVDLVPDHSLLAPLYQRAPDGIEVSAATGAGLGALSARLQELLAEHGRRVELLIPHSAAGLQSEIRRNTTVLAESYTDEGCRLDCIASPALLARWLMMGVRLQETPPADPTTGSSR